MSLNGRTATTRARNVRKAIRIPRSMGSAALALAYVANGRFDAFIQQGGLSAWDVAAAGLIAERGRRYRDVHVRRSVVRPGAHAQVDRHPGRPVRRTTATLLDLAAGR